MLLKIIIISKIRKKFSPFILREIEQCSAACQILLTLWLEKTAHHSGRDTKPGSERRENRSIPNQREKKMAWRDRIKEKCTNKSKGKRNWKGTNIM